MAGHSALNNRPAKIVRLDLQNLTSRWRARFSSIELGFNTSELGSLHSTHCLVGFIENLQLWVCSCFLVHDFVCVGDRRLKHYEHPWPPLHMGSFWDVRCFCGVQCYNYEVNVLCITKPRLLFVSTGKITILYTCSINVKLLIIFEPMSLPELTLKQFFQSS